MNFKGNDSSLCNLVDDEDAANLGLAPFDNWSIPERIVFSEDCGY